MNFCHKKMLKKINKKLKNSDNSSILIVHNDTKLLVQCCTLFLLTRFPCDESGAEYIYIRHLVLHYIGVMCHVVEFPPMRSVASCHVICS